jgi:hypothetical protein
MVSVFQWKLHVFGWSFPNLRRVFDRILEVGDLVVNQHWNPWNDGNSKGELSPNGRFFSGEWIMIYDDDHLLRWTSNRFFGDKITAGHLLMATIKTNEYKWNKFLKLLALMFSMNLGYSWVGPWWIPPAIPLRKMINHWISGYAIDILTIFRHT